MTLTLRSAHVFCFGFCMFASAALAGVGRDDLPDDAFRALAGGFESVGLFHGSSHSGGFLGSGTLIADDWVLTAGHNVDTAQSLDFHIGGQWYEATDWIAHPGWDGNLGAGYDIALVQLDAPVAGVDPAARYRGSGEAGRAGTSVGFGRGGSGSTGTTTGAGTKRAGQNVVDRLDARSGGRILLSDFDDPLDPSSNVAGGGALPMEYLIAPGDSGGGLFLDSPAGPLLAGVHSFGAALDGLIDSDYGDLSGHTRVSAFNDWIDAVIGFSANATLALGDTTALVGDALQLGADRLPVIPEPTSGGLLCLATLLLVPWRCRC